MKAHFINLAGRADRNYLMQKNWEGIVQLQRIQGVIFPDEKFGAKGCYKGHFNAFQEAKKSNTLSVICEDDIVPTSDFIKKLTSCVKELPFGWTMLMVGCNCNERTTFEKITNNISKAVSHVTAGHCYIINPFFYDRFQAELDNPENGENFDVLLMNLQKKYDVYVCIPTLCYQYESFSNNSNRIVGNTITTKKYFKE